MATNLCAKKVKPEDAYEVWANDEMSWIFYVLKKYKSPEAEAKDPFARWFCATSSPMTHGRLEYGDGYADTITWENHRILNPLRPVVETRKAYEADPGPFWENASLLGDGYDVMQAAKNEDWHSISSWGKDAWDLGSWPYVIVFFRRKNGMFQVLQYVEGDVTMWSCPNKWIRQQIVDGIAFFYWKHSHAEWVKDFDSIDKVPLDSELRGPSRS